MAFVVEVKSGSDYKPEDYAPPGFYQGAEIIAVTPFKGKKYKTDEDQMKAIVTWQVTDGPFAGKIAEQFYTASLHKKSNLQPVFIAATGIVPQPGTSPDLEMMIGHKTDILVNLVTGGDGNARPKVVNVMASQFNQLNAQPSVNVPNMAQGGVAVGAAPAQVYQQQPAAVAPPAGIPAGYTVINGQLVAAGVGAAVGAAVANPDEDI